MSNKPTAKMVPGVRCVEVVDAFVSAPTTNASLYDAENMVNEEFHEAPGRLQREPVDHHARRATLELQAVFNPPARAALSQTAGMVVQ